MTVACRVPQEAFEEAHRVLEQVPGAVRGAEDQPIFADLDRLCRLYAAQVIVADAVARMRSQIPALRPDEIARTFRDAAEELGGAACITGDPPEAALENFWDNSPTRDR
jgi:hypothetical protein